MPFLRQSLFTLGAILCVWPHHAHAGAWLQKKGEGLAVMQATYFTTDEFFDASGNRQPQARFDKYELNLYGEYGYDDWLTLGTNLFLNQVEQGNQDNYGIADSEFFARTTIYENETLVLSLQPLIKLPSAYQNDIALRGGSRSTDMELSVLAGIRQPIISERDYVDLRAGYRDRNRGLDGQWRLDAVMGVFVAKDWSLIAAMRSVISTADTASRANFREDGEQEYDLLKAELGVQYDVSEEYWVHLTGFRHIDGLQAGGGEGITIGVGMRF